jgi:hypothetical protein
MVQDVAGDTAKDEARHAGPPVRAHQDEISFRSVRCGQELRGGVTVSPIGLGREARTPQLRRHLSRELVM